MMVPVPAEHRARTTRSFYGLRQFSRDPFRRGNNVLIGALKGENVDELLETIMLVAELQELKANPHRSAKGTVIEAGLHKSEGPVATFIVQNGTLKGGDIVVCGEAFGKVRALFDDKGNRVDEAGPSIPVQLVWKGRVIYMQCRRFMCHACSSSTSSGLLGLLIPLMCGKSFPLVSPTLLLEMQLLDHPLLAFSILHYGFLT